MGDVVFGAEAGHLLAEEISSIVGDDGVGDPQATYYVFPVVLDNLLPANLEQRHYLNPNGEVAGGY